MLGRWEPFCGIRRKGDVFTELNRMQQEMNRFFDDFFGEHRSDMAEGQWTPSIDVAETQAAIVVRAELPGMSQEDIELNLQDNVLTLTGEKKPEKNAEQENLHRSECCYGKFSRSFTLPANVDQQKVQATFNQGILEITLPKMEEPKPKKISVTVG